MVRQQEAASQSGRWKGWQLEGTSAEAYEQFLVPIFMAPGAQFLMELTELSPGERVLDIATGTGIVARSAAERVGAHGSVTGLDLNDAMLDVARTKSAQFQPAIEWRQGNAADLPFPHASFDVVFCQQGLQFFPDRPAALSEMHRVLAPNGRLALAVMRSVQHNPSYALLADVVERYLGSDAAATMRSPFANLGPDDLRELITEAGFHDVRITIVVAPVRFPSAEEFMRQEVASSPLATPIGSIDSETREALLDDLRTTLRPYTDDNGVTFPAEVHFAAARQ